MASPWRSPPCDTPQLAEWRMLPPCENSHPLVLAAVDLLQLEVLASDVVQQALVKPEPDHALLNLQADHAVIVEGWDDGRVLLGPLRPGDGLAAPEDVLSTAISF